MMDLAPQGAPWLPTPPAGGGQQGVRAEGSYYGGVAMMMCGNIVPVDKGKSFYKVLDLKCKKAAACQIPAQRQSTQK